MLKQGGCHRAGHAGLIENVEIAELKCVLDVLLQLGRILAELPPGRASPRSCLRPKLAFFPFRSRRENGGPHRGMRRKAERLHGAARIYFPGGRSAVILIKSFASARNMTIE